jgi:predicted AAA+ superfamily ATPase
LRPISDSKTEPDASGDAAGLSFNITQYYTNEYMDKLAAGCSLQKTKAGREVDFIAGRQGPSRMLVQACESMADQQTRKRETSALAEAMTELKLSQGIIVTCNEAEQIQVDSGKIDVVPAWRFLLNMPGSA